MVRKSLLGLVMAAGAATGPLHAETVSGTMTVSATVERSCNLTAQPLRFGTVRDDAATAQADGAVAVRCTPDTMFLVEIDQGRHRDGGHRRMASADGGGFLAYELYSDAARTRRWGSDQTSAVTGQAPADGAVVLPVYGRLSLADAPSGTYSDVVTVTLQF